jgi:GLPGLI family protein
MDSNNKLTKLFFILLIIKSYGIYSQNESLTIVYKLKISDDKTLFLKNEYLRNSLNNVVKNNNEILFNLELNDSISKFYIQKNINNIDENILSFSLALSSYSGEVYNFKNDSVLKKSEIIGNKFLVKQNKSNSWTISNETKKIDNYLCYKATTTYDVVGENKIFNHPVIAWFCPEIPINYGPNGYGKLPGLILELQVRNSTFGIKSISPDKKLEINKDFFEKKKIITEDELNKKLMEFNNFEKK